MDQTVAESKLREQLKILLYYFAKHSEQPGRELQDMLRDVIQELYAEIAEATAAKSKIRLVVSNHH